MRRSLEELARLHARFWDQEIADFPLALPMRQDDASSDWPRRNGPPVIAKYLSGPRGATVPAALRDPERIDRAFWVHLEHLGRDRPYCILHGDTHPGNGFIDSTGAPGFFDWQTIAKGPWAYDVAYHIVSSLSVEDRRRYESDLLRHYLGALAISGVTKPPGFDHAWLQYRRYIAYGLHIWITNPAEFQPEENCLEMTQRFAHAAADLDFFAAWGV
jgi:aminoglycoside phosphotransferase (APT) family kinase protein